MLEARTKGGLLLVLCSVTIPWAAQGAETETGIPWFTAQYDLSRDDLQVGRVRVQFSQPRPHHYLYTTRSGPSGMLALFHDQRVTESSAGAIEQGSLRPLEYRYRHTSGDEARVLDMQFDWDAKQVSIDSEGKRWTLPVPDGALDKLVQQLALMQALGTEIANVDFQVADGGSLKGYHYRVEGRETLALPDGPVETIRVRRYKQDQPSRLTLWCAPDLYFLPVRLDRRQNDTVYRMELTSVTGL